MKRVIVAFAIASIAVSVDAQLLVPTARGVVVAHDGRIMIDGGWTADGARNATEIVASDDRVAVLDALHDEVVIADLDTGRTTRVRTAATPIAAAFLGRDLYVLARDARMLQRIGGGADIPLAPDPAFLHVSNGRLYVYSRATGIVQEIERDRVVREVTVAPFASDLEIAGTTAYLAYPREARIRTVDLREMKATGAIAAGGVPIDVAIAGGGTALTARILAVADPASKRVWLVEATQSTAKAFGRGFLRGLLGLGLFTNRSSEFPTGVDRVITRGNVTLAYDTTSGTLYRVRRKKVSRLAANVAPGAFGITDDGAVVWWNGVRVRERVVTAWPKVSTSPRDHAAAHANLPPCAPDPGNLHVNRDPHEANLQSSPTCLTFGRNRPKSRYVRCTLRLCHERQEVVREMQSRNR